jgi:hypothetical protein
LAVFQGNIRNTEAHSAKKELISVIEKSIEVLRLDQCSLLDRYVLLNCCSEVLPNRLDQIESAECLIASASQ